MRRISFSTAGLYPRDTIDSLALLAKAGYREAELMPQCREETAPAFALVGFTFAVNDRLVLDAGFKWGLNKQEVDRAVTAGITLSF